MAEYEPIGSVRHEMSTAKEARDHLVEVRARLASGEATPGEHRAALEAITWLPGVEADSWLIEITRGFAIVHSRERDERAEAAPADDLDGSEHP